MGCKCATFDEDEGRYKCSVSDSDCAFVYPNSKECARLYNEGPDSLDSNDDEEHESSYDEDFGDEDDEENTLFEPIKNSNTNYEQLKEYCKNREFLDKLQSLRSANKGENEDD